MKLFFFSLPWLSLTVSHLLHAKLLFLIYDDDEKDTLFPWKNWLWAEELFTLVALSNSEGREKRNITFPITMLYFSLIPKSWLKSREESSRDITICKTNHTNHTQTAQLSTLEHQSLAYEDKGGIELKKQMNFFGTNWSMVMHFLL